MSRNLMKPLEMPFEILQLDAQGDSSSLRWETAAVEEPITLHLNDVFSITFQCLPNNLRELALGFLVSEGIIKIAAQPKIDVCIEDRAVLVTVERDDILIADVSQYLALSSGCGKGLSRSDRPDLGRFKPRTVTPAQKFQVEQLRKLLRLFGAASPLYRSTHGVHTSAVGVPTEIVSVADDVGRHNAVDKVIGDCVLRELPLEDKLLLSTGRITIDIISKAVRTGIPTIVALSAPTAAAVEIAREFNLTLIARSRPSRISIFHGAERLLRETS